MTIATELNLLLQEAQDKLPANPLSTKNLKLADDFQEELSKYFKVLAAAFPYRKLRGLYSRHVKESLGSETDAMLDPFIRVVTASYFTRLNGRLAMIYMVGSVQMMTWAGVPYEGPPMATAIDYASKRAGWLIKNMDKETVSRLGRVISEGIAKKRGVPGITSDLRHVFTDMSTHRAKMIARTETADALGEAFMDRAKDMKIEAKESITSNPCPICQANEGDGVIPIDESFTSGHLRPPFHPNCRCAVAPARLKK